MAVVTPSSPAIQKIDSGVTPVLNDSARWRSSICRSEATMSKAAGDSNNSLYRLLRVHSSMLIGAMPFLTAAWGTSGAIDVGLYQTPANGGAIVGTGQEFGASIDVSAAIATKKDLSVLTDPTVLDKKVWERLGLTQDPNLDYDIVVKAVNIGASQNAAFWLAVDFTR